MHVCCFFLLFIKRSDKITRTLVEIYMFLDLLKEYSMVTNHNISLSPLRLRLNWYAKDMIIVFRVT